MTDWFAQPHFWERVYPLMFSAERDERAHEEVANLFGGKEALAGRLPLDRKPSTTACC